MAMFTYNTNPNADLPAPLFPDFSPNSEMSKKMMQAKQEGKNFWLIMREVFAHDLKTLPKSRFKAWASVWTVPFMETPRYSYFTQVALTAAAQDPIYKNALIDVGVGMNQQDAANFYEFTDFPTTMNRMIAMTHFVVCGWTPEKLSKLDKIVELGGGIGEMCDIAYRLGFKGEYKIFDFPELNQIQSYYMSELGNDKAVFASELEDISDADLVIGTWSFTEMPIDLREKLMERLGKSKNWLIAYSNKIFDLDNKRYIENTFIPQIENGKNVEIIDIPNMPWDGGSHYLSAKENT